MVADAADDSLSAVGGSRRFEPSRSFFEAFVVAGQESDATDSSIQTNPHQYFTQ